MNFLSPALLAAIALGIRTMGRPVIVRALTVPQSSIKAIPGRKNQDITEIQAQSAQVAEQVVQFAESVFDAAWTDPDLEAAHPDTPALLQGLANAANAFD